MSYPDNKENYKKAEKEKNPEKSIPAPQSDARYGMASSPDFVLFRPVEALDQLIPTMKKPTETTRMNTQQSQSPLESSPTTEARTPKYRYRSPELSSPQGDPLKTKKKSKKSKKTKKKKSLKDKTERKKTSKDKSSLRVTGDLEVTQEEGSGRETKKKTEKKRGGRKNGERTRDEEEKTCREEKTLMQRLFGISKKNSHSKSSKSKKSADKSMAQSTALTDTTFDEEAVEVEEKSPCATVFEDINCPPSPAVIVERNRKLRWKDGCETDKSDEK